jgi:hypothetical protein
LKHVSTLKNFFYCLNLDVVHFQIGTKTAIHLCIHLLGIHLYILTQVRQRKTFLKVGQSLLARKDLELETQFKDHMIQSVMPKKVKILFFLNLLIFFYFYFLLHFGESG